MQYFESIAILIAKSQSISISIAKSQTYCNTIAKSQKYYNTYGKTSKVLQYLLQNLKRITILIVKFQSIAIGIAKSQSIAIICNTIGTTPENNCDDSDNSGISIACFTDLQILRKCAQIFIQGRFVNLRLSWNGIQTE